MYAVIVARPARRRRAGGDAEHRLQRRRPHAPGPDHGRGGVAEQPDGGAGAGDRAQLLRWVSHRPPGDWLIGLPFFTCCGAASSRAAVIAWRFFRTPPAPLRRATRIQHDPIARQDPDPRLRLPGHAADRAPRARGARVLRDPPERRVATTFIREFAPKGIILSGSHASTYEDARPARAARGVGSSACRCSASATACSRWRCSSAARSRRARIASSAMPRCARTATPSCSTASRTSRTAEGHGMLKVWMSHGDKVTALPPGFKLMASTPSCPIAGMADEARALLRRAVPPRGHAHAAAAGRCSSASCSRSAAPGPTGSCATTSPRRWRAIREQVGDEEVILGLSGGVDSSVAAALIHRAIGDQLTCVFVDHGLLRLNEGEDGDGDVRRPAARQGDARRCQRAVPRRTSRA